MDDGAHGPRPGADGCGSRCRHGEADPASRPVRRARRRRRADPGDAGEDRRGGGAGRYGRGDPAGRRRRRRGDGRPGAPLVRPRPRPPRDPPRPRRRRMACALLEHARSRRPAPARGGGAARTAADLRGRAAGGTWRAPLAASPLFGEAEVRSFRISQQFTTQDLCDRVASTSFVAAMDPVDREELVVHVRALTHGVEEPFEFRGPPLPSNEGSRRIRAG